MTFLLTIFGILTLAILLAVANTIRHVRRFERQWPPLGRIAQTPRRRIHYHDIPSSNPARDETPVVFIHGASGNLRDQVAAFAPIIGGRFRAIFVDRPGAGYTERKPGDHDPHEQAGIVADILDHLGIERAIVCGHSYGAGCAATFAIDCPDRVAQLVLLAPASHPWPGRLSWPYRLAATPGIRELVTWTIAVPLGLRMIPDGVAATFAPDGTPEGYGDEAGIPLMLRPRNFLANAADILYIKRHASNLSPRYREIEAPTLIVSGTADAVVRHTIHAVGLHRAIPNAVLREVPGMGHKPDYVMARTVCERLTVMVQEECPDARRPEPLDRALMLVAAQ